MSLEAKPPAGSAPVVYLLLVLEHAGSLKAPEISDRVAHLGSVYLVGRLTECSYLTVDHSLGIGYAGYLIAVVGEARDWLRK